MKCSLQERMVAVIPTSACVILHYVRQVNQNVKLTMYQSLLIKTNVVLNITVFADQKLVQNHQLVITMSK